MRAPVPPRRSARLAAAGSAALGLCLAAATVAHAQTTGRILGTVVDAESGAPIAAAEVSLPAFRLETLTSERGLFVLAGVPAGEHVVRVRRLGYRPAVVEAVGVGGGRATELRIALRPAAVEVEGLVVEAERTLIEPDVSASREILPSRELLELPIDEIEEAIELTPGVSDGHFRGGRVGQETYLLDGLEIKDAFAASGGGPRFEIAPTALEEVEVVTGGLGAADGSALSGTVRYVTKRGNPARWEGRVALRSDQWAPDDLFRGFTGLSASAGGPAPFLGAGATLFLDLLAEGKIDAEPRARGLTCLQPEDADADLADEIRALRDDPATAHLHCPYTAPSLPFQRGDRWIGFLRFDRPLGREASLTASVLHNRRQQELYTPEFKYNPRHHLGRRSHGLLGSLTIEWTKHVRGRAYQVTLRAAGAQLDRYLGVVDPRTFEDRGSVADFGPADFRFLGEEFVRGGVDAQLESGRPVPGYVAPGGSVGSPFGPAAEGIFFTQGTPEIAAWSRSGFLGLDLVGEMLAAEGHAIRVGLTGRLHRVESYERTRSHLPGSAPNYARFYPRTLSGFTEATLAAADDVTIRFGLRFDGFRSGLFLPETEGDLTAPLLRTDWKTSWSPRIGVAIPVPGTQRRAALRFNYGLVTQPPDFRYFLSTTIDDSLRADIQRQGNPDLAFERGSAYELALSHLLSDEVAVELTAHYKELRNLVTGSLVFSGIQPGQFTTGDFGSVRGVELAIRARWAWIAARAGYALQKATGVTSGALEDTLIAEHREFPLAFDRRHSVDVALFAGRAAGARDRRWAVALTGYARSGFPLDRALAGGSAPASPGNVPARLPWTAAIDLRAGYEMGAPPGCASCRWRVVADGRNVLGRRNVIALRRDTGLLAPARADLVAIADEVPPDADPIPRESPRYSSSIDLDGNGLITAGELRTARFAAALDRHDPSLFFGEARQLRLGLEVSF